tara:strand:+ start:73137 stop:73562 length:426 start_codon:yes stop_codon:yes gene_type:complete
MKLSISTPLTEPVVIDDVAHLRAEDDTGSFGILENHACLITVVGTSVLSWRCHDDSEGHCAVRAGILNLPDGHRISVTAREAILGDSLEHLEDAVLVNFRRREAEERSERADIERLRISAIRRICGYLRDEPASLTPIGTS